MAHKTLDGTISCGVFLAQYPHFIYLLCPCAPAVIKAGYYAAGFKPSGAVSSVLVCPQGSYCLGGEAAPPAAGRRHLAQTAGDGTPTPCPDGMWTEQVGATSPEQCCECLHAAT